MKLIRNAVPSIPSDPVSTPDFDTKRFCSGVCAGHICCTICATFKLLAQYIHIVNGRLNIQVPVHCYWHISPTGRDFNREAACIECIKSYITIRLRDRGLEGLNCITRGCNHSSGFSGRDWRDLALGYLPPELHAQFFEQSIRLFMSKEQIWICPNGCDTPGVTVQPNATPGYPHVECPSCSGRICTGCKVAWHKGQTCQQYQLEHPTVLTDDERAVIENLAKLGARRCPVCQFIIIKEGGCSHINCEQCRHDFDWRTAEKVRPLQSVGLGKRPRARRCRKIALRLWKRMATMITMTTVIRKTTTKSSSLSNTCVRWIGFGRSMRLDCATAEAAATYCWPTRLWYWIT